MPRIICRYDVCVFNKKLRCTAEAIEYDPDQGCLTAQTRDEFAGLVEDDDPEEDEALVPDEDDRELDADELDDGFDEDDLDDDEFDEDDEDEEADDAEDVRPSRKRL